MSAGNDRSTDQSWAGASPEERATLSPGIELIGFDGNEGRCRHLDIRCGGHGVPQMPTDEEVHERWVVHGNLVVDFHIDMKPVVGGAASMLLTRKRIIGAFGSGTHWIDLPTPESPGVELDDAGSRSLLTFSWRYEDLSQVFIEFRKKLLSETFVSTILFGGNAGAALIVEAAAQADDEWNCAPDCEADDLRKLGSATGKIAAQDYLDRGAGNPTNMQSLIAGRWPSGDSPFGSGKRAYAATFE